LQDEWEEEAWSSFFLFSNSELFTLLQSKSYEGYHKMWHQLKSVFFLGGEMDLFSKAFFRKCDICQRNKTNFYDHCLFLVLYGPISPRILLIGYLILEVNPIIFVVVNRFSKYAHFIALKHSYSTMVVTQVFSFLFFFFF
jgi:hypothetical protein